jgi:hypothetical protein
VGLAATGLGFSAGLAFTSAGFVWAKGLSANVMVMQKMKQKIKKTWNKIFFISLPPLNGSRIFILIDHITPPLYPFTPFRLE